MTTGRTLSGRYELTSPIGRGGMGEVYSAYDKRLDRPVAVKLLRADALPPGADRHTFAKRFAREARLTARVEHAGVPAVFDAGVDGEALYLVMQLVPGTDLADFLAESGALPIETVCALAAQVAAVLAAAHRVSLVHRDLKPRNIIIRPDGTVVVLDFGVAALLDADLTRLTGTGDMIGSPAYMAPEQVLGGKAGTRSDLYALGCILHELLAGTRPFTAEGSFAAMRQHVDEAPPELRSLRGDVPADLAELVTELLAKDPAKRPADAGEVYERLHAYLPQPGGSPARSGSSGASDPTRPYRQPYAPPPGGGDRAPAEQADVEPVDVEQARDEAVRLAEAGRFTQAAGRLASVLHDPAALPSPQARGVRLQLANTLLLGGDYAGALPHYQRLVDELAPERSAEDTDILDWRVQVATCRDALGDTTGALAGLVPVLDIQQRRLGKTDPGVVDLRRQVALLRASTGETERATAELRRLTADLGPNHPATPDLTEILRRLVG